jgi:hypothetical protein
VQTDDSLKQSLLGIRSGSLRLTALVEEFISLAELKTGEAQIVYKMNAKLIENPASILYEATQILKQKYKGKGWDFVFEMSNTLPPIFGGFTILTKNIVRSTELGIKVVRGTAKNQVTFYSDYHDGLVSLHIHFQNEIPGKQLATFKKLLVHDEEEMLSLSEYAPTLLIMKGLCDLHNGRFNLDNNDGFHIEFYLPAKTATNKQFDHNTKAGTD